MFTQLIESLTTPHPVDRYLELVRPAWTPNEARATVTAVERQTPDSITLRLKPNRAWRGHRAGQFVQLTVEINGVQHRRCYSPACSEHARELELTIRRHPEGTVSGYLNERARPGMVLGLSQADGDFVLPADRPERVVLISGGSGITPVMSMLRTLRDEGREHTATFLHYARGAEDMNYRDELAASSATVVRAFTRADGGELRGHFCPEHLGAAAGEQTFVCGPPALIDAVRHCVDESLFHAEHFVPPAPAVVLGEAEGTVSFARSGADAENSGAPLLDQAEAAGLTPAHGCRMGICHSCTCRKLAGSVRNTRTGEISTAADEDIQICISVPVGDVELDL